MQISYFLLARVVDWHLGEPDVEAVGKLEVRNVLSRSFLSRRVPERETLLAQDDDRHRH